MAKNALDWIVLILVIINIIYWLIGLAALYTIWIAIKK